MEPLTLYLIAIPALLILSVVASKGASRFGIPALSVFLLIGILVGREGPGGSRSRTTGSRRRWASWR